MGLAIILGGHFLRDSINLTGAVDTLIGSAFLLFLPAALGASVRYRANSRLSEMDQVKLREREHSAIAPRYLGDRPTGLGSHA